MESHHQELAERADRMHELLRMLREAEVDGDALRALRARRGARGP
jgi:hypothetical protein